MEEQILSYKENAFIPEFLFKSDNITFNSPGVASRLSMNLRGARLCKAGHQATAEACVLLTVVGVFGESQDPMFREIQLPSGPIRPERGSLSLGQPDEH